MSFKKFTEEQYQKILETVNKYPNFGEQYVVGVAELSTTYDELIEEIFGSMYESENHPLKVERMLSLANPLTREWAYDKFVEKEKKYIWESKQQTGTGRVKRLYDSAIGITDSFKDKTELTHNDNLITETEMRKWGYNPDMFDKEEIK